MPEPDAAIATLEAIIFATPGPTGVAQIRRVLPRLAPQRIAELVEEINIQLLQGGRPYEIVEVAGGYQFRTRPEFGEQLAAARPERKLRLSRAAVETLSVIAYKQPTTRAEIEDLRCVDCGAVLKGLLDRQLVRIVGRRDAPGKPALYGTSAGFLETFGLKSLRELPELREVLAMEQSEGTPIEEAREDDELEPAGPPEPREAEAALEATTEEGALV